MFVTRYMQWDTQHSRPCVRDTYCPPGEFPATTNILFRNRGDGTFAEVIERSGIAPKKGRSLGVAFNDYDGDGFADIIVANDAMEEFLFHNNRNGTFTERALEAGVALSDDGKPYAGMGVDFKDYDNDRRPDILITNLAKQVYAVYYNDGNGSFSCRSLETGMGTLSAGNSGWGMKLEDLNNDAWMHVVMLVLGGQPVIFRNRCGKAHWPTISLEGTRSNRDGIGARVVANGQTQYATTAGSYPSASDKRVHFGLGDAAKADAEIWWPSGIHQKLDGVPADQFLRLREPK